MMDKELKAKWVSALRSGKYKQTVNCLHNDDGFCCLGVLADIKGVEWLREEGKEYGQETYVFYAEVYGKDKQHDIAVPPGWLHFIGRIEPTLVNMNDGNDALGVTPHTFSEIADFIENSVDI